MLALLSFQRIKQCLGVLEVRRVKALGEPAIDGRQKLAGFSRLPCCCQRRLRLMAARSSTTWPAAGGRRPGPAANRLPPAACGTPAAAGATPRRRSSRLPTNAPCAPSGLGLGQRRGGRLRGGPVGRDLRQQGQEIRCTAWPLWLGWRRSPGGPRPAPPRPGPAWPAPTRGRSCPGPPRWKALSVASVDGGLGLLVHRRHVPTILIDVGRLAPAPTPDYRDATARAPTPVPRGGGPGLAPGTPVTTAPWPEPRQTTPSPCRSGTPEPGVTGV